MSYSIIVESYRDEKSVIILPYWAYQRIYYKLGHLLKVKTKYSAGFSMSEYFLNGVKIEKSYWCSSNTGYFVDKNGNLHTLYLDEEKGTFNVIPSISK